MPTWPNGSEVFRSPNLWGAGLLPSPAWWSRGGAALNGVSNDYASNKSSLPEGMAPNAYLGPIAAGGIAADASDSVTSANDITANAQSASVMGSTMVSASTIQGAVGLVVPMAADLLSACTVSADTKLSLQLAANLASQGQAVAALGAIANVVCAMTSAGTCAADLKGSVRMGGTMSTAGDILTAQAVASEVWSALASAFNQPGSMGAKLNAAGSASNPWTDPVGAQVAAFVERIKLLIEADEVHTASLVRKLQAGTDTVLLEKQHSGTPLQDLSVTEP